MEDPRVYNHTLGTYLLLSRHCESFTSTLPLMFCASLAGSTLPWHVVLTYLLIVVSGLFSQASSQSASSHGNSVSKHYWQALLPFRMCARSLPKTDQCPLLYERVPWGTPSSILNELRSPRLGTTLDSLRFCAWSSLRSRRIIWNTCSQRLNCITLPCLKLHFSPLPHGSHFHLLPLALLFVLVVEQHLKFQ